MNNLAKHMVLTCLMLVTTQYSYAEDRERPRRERQHEQRYYVKAIASMAWPQKLDLKGHGIDIPLGSPTRDIGYGIALGYILPECKDINLELGYRSYSFSTNRMEASSHSGISGNTQSRVVDLSGYYFVNYNIFKPYVKFGLGFAKNKNHGYLTGVQADGTPTSDRYLSKDRTNLMYSAGLGVEAGLNNNLKVGLGYTYQNLGNVSVDRGHIASRLPNAIQMSTRPFKLKKLIVNGADLYIKYAF